LQQAETLAKIGMMIERMPELRTLSPSDKLALVTELWDDLASNPEDIPITPEQMAEVDRRLEEYPRNLPPQCDSTELAERPSSSVPCSRNYGGQGGATGSV
jgi:putative addiction module component (TIGR02574 family)